MQSGILQRYLEVTQEQKRSGRVWDRVLIGWTRSAITTVVQVYVERPIHTAPATPDGYKSKPLLVLHMSTYYSEQFFLK